MGQRDNCKECGSAQPHPRDADLLSRDARRNQMCRQCWIGYLDNRDRLAWDQEQVERYRSEGQ